MSYFTPAIGKYLGRFLGFQSRRRINCEFNQLYILNMMGFAERFVYISIIHMNKPAYGTSKRKLKTL